MCTFTLASEEEIIYICFIHRNNKEQILFLELVHCRIKNSFRSLLFPSRKIYINFVFQNLSVNASIFTLTAIAVDRYFYSIRKETLYCNVKTKRLHTFYKIWNPRELSSEWQSWLSRYRAIMYPLKSHSSKYRTKVTIIIMWILSTILAIPMAIAFRSTVAKVENSFQNSFLHTDSISWKVVHSFGYFWHRLSWYDNNSDYIPFNKRVLENGMKTLANPGNLTFNTTWHYLNENVNVDGCYF